MKYNKIFNERRVQCAILRQICNNNITVYHGKEVLHPIDDIKNNNVYWNRIYQYWGW
jgi:hypothetical protein